MATLLAFSNGIKVGVAEMPITLPEPKKVFPVWSGTATGFVVTYYYDKLFFGHIMGTLTKKQESKYRLLQVIKIKRKRR